MIQITNVNKRFGIDINSKDIKRITNGTIMNNILTIFMKIDKFLRGTNYQEVTQEETDNTNSPISNF